MKTKPIRSIFLGVRIGDPTAVWNTEPFSPLSYYSEIIVLALSDATSTQNVAHEYENSDTSSW